LLTLEDIQRYDTRGMHEVYNNWPNLAKNAYQEEYKSVEFEDTNHIIFAGMGGSGTICDLFSSIFSKTNLHVNVVKGYLLPKTVDKQTLIIPISVSGNTVETLIVLKTAKSLGCKIISFSSGGKMEEYCKENNLLHRKIKQTHSPRGSFVSYAYAILKILSPFIPIEKNEILKSISDLEITAKEINSENLSKTNSALSLAEWIKGIPSVYYPWGLQAAAIRFKNSMQENSKSHTIVEDIIEVCHNGIVAWEKKSNVEPILLQGKDDYIKTKERWKILKEYFKEKNIPFYEVYSVNGNILSKLINLIYVLDYASIYFAILSKTDPSPIKSIDFIKRKLG